MSNYSGKESQYIWSRVPDSVRIRHSGRTENRGVTQPVQLKENLTYDEIPVQIVDCKEQVLRSKVIPLVKVLWKNHEREAATWETEAQMRHQYPHLFSG